MTSISPTLRASIFATIAAGTLAFGPANAADGRRDWRDYAWQGFAIADCLPTDATLACPPFHQKWDWKRDQWVDIAITIDPASHRLHLTQTLTNHDRHDRDYVCVTALVLDAQGRDLVAHHQNWRISAGQVLSNSFDYAAPGLEAAATIQIGSKQCRDGAGEDDATYAEVLAGLKN